MIIVEIIQSPHIFERRIIFCSAPLLAIYKL